MANERLWAPWRMDYIKGETRRMATGGEAAECIFCTKPQEGDDEAALILHRGERCFVILNAFPYNNGHLMVAPYAHQPAVDALEPETLLEMMVLTQRCTRAIDAAYHPEGYNIGINQGKVAGAGMEHHLHLHVVPRWGADTNFMPVLADTRVLPQRLADSYAQLEAAFAATGQGGAA